MAMRLRSLRTALCLLALALQAPAATPAHSVENVPPFLLQWGAYGSTGNGLFGRPDAIAVGPQGNVYVSDKYYQRIQVFNGSGTFATQWGRDGTLPGQFDGQVYGLAVSAAGDVYVTTASRVQRFSSAGVFIQQWGTFGTAPGQFGYAWGIAIDSDGFVYVADHENDRIQKFTSAGVFVSKWGTRGSNAGQFKGPTAIAIDAQNNIYVGELGGYRIQGFRPDSTWFVGWSGSLSDSTSLYPYGMCADGYGHLYVPMYSFAKVVIYDGSGVLRYQWGSLGSAPGEFSHPLQAAFDQAGSLYITDGDNYRIQKFAAGGVLDAVPSGGLKLSVRVMGSPVRGGAVSFQISGSPRQEIAGGIYDLAGRRIAELGGRPDEAGELRIHWQDGTSKLSSGVYFIKIRQASEAALAKFVVVR